MKLSTLPLAACLTLMWATTFPAVAGQTSASGLPSGGSAPSWSTYGVGNLGYSSGSVPDASNPSSGVPLGNPSAAPGTLPGYASPDDLDKDDEEDFGSEIDDEEDDE